MPRPPARHGTRSGYSKHRRDGGTDPDWPVEPCDPCREANRRYIEAGRRAAGVRPFDEFVESIRREPAHGSARRYRKPWRCRCDECRANENARHCRYWHRRRERRRAS